MEKTLIAIVLISTSFTASAEVTDGGSSTGSNNGNYSKIGVTGFADLDVFEGNAPGGKIKGVVLECSRDNKDGKIGFCTNADCTSSRTANAGVKISKEYAEYIEEWGYKCFKLMMDTKEFGCEGGVAMCGVGGHAKRNAQNDGDTGVPSRHSTGDAMDVSGSLYCGNKKIVTFTKDGRAKNSKAYDAFTKCWDETAKQAYASQDSTDKRKYMSGGGCIGCEGSQLHSQNDGHNDHIHMSAPIYRPGRISAK